MLYQASFVVSLLLLIIILSSEVKYGVTHVVFLLMLVIGNAGFAALHYASNLSEALLANKVSYVTGMFIPMLLFMINCEICAIKLKRFVVFLMHAVQCTLFIFVCAIGQNDLFYKNVEFGRVDGSSFLIKTYGPLHTVYLVTMFGYLFGGIIVAVYSLHRKNIVSARNVDIILTSEFLTIACYTMERALKLSVELLPILLLAAEIVVCYPITKIRMYSVWDNEDYFKRKFARIGILVFDKKMHYMGSNEYMAELFPEAGTWELEKKVPGSGGRFNTFLRQPLLHYIRENEEEPKSGKPFVLDGHTFRYSISRMLNDKQKHLGYIVEVEEQDAEESIATYEEITYVEGAEHY